VAEPTIQEQVEHAFNNLDDKQFQLAQSFIAGLFDRLANAERAAAKGFVLFLSAWAIIYLIANGSVNEANIGGMKLSNLKNLLIVGPIILGYLSYVFSAALATTLILEGTIRECYSKFIPKLGETKLDTLVSSHTFIGAEEQDVLTTRTWVESFLGTFILVCIVLFSWVASLGAIIHVTRMLFHLSLWPKAVIVGFFIAGTVLWLRGASFIYHRTVTPASTSKTPIS
jgi:hypothetical protein